MHPHVNLSTTTLMWCAVCLHMASVKTCPWGLKQSQSYECNNEQKSKSNLFWNKVIRTFSWTHYMRWINDLQIQIFSGTFCSWRDKWNPRMGNKNLTFKNNYSTANGDGESTDFWVSQSGWGGQLPHRGLRWAQLLCLPKEWSQVLPQVSSTDTGVDDFFSLHLLILHLGHHRYFTTKLGEHRTELQCFPNTFTNTSVGFLSDRQFSATESRKGIVGPSIRIFLGLPLCQERCTHL